MSDDSTFLEKALQEYREATWDDADFHNLPREIQSMILGRAQQLKDGAKREDVVPG